MHKLPFLNLIALLAAMAFYGQAIASTETLPAGVRAFVYKYMYGTVPSSYGDTGVEEGLNVNATLGSSILRNLSKETSVAYDEISNIDPQLANNLDLGRVDLDPKITASINGFALAWGLTDQIMIGGLIPIYQASVDIEGGYSNTASLNNTIAKLKAYANDAALTQAQRDAASILAQVLTQLPTMRGEYLQGAVVNDFKYKPVGNWKGNGVGDLELFTQFRFLERDYYAQAIKVGQILPNGRVDDPDNLLDIPFGTGFFSTYAESLHDFSLIERLKLMLSLGLRYQYNWATDRTYRLTPESNFPLTAKKEVVPVKPGNSWSFSSEIGSRLWKDISWNTSYSFKNKSADHAQGVDRNYNYGILTQSSASNSQTVGAGLTYSTVENYRRKKFPVPLTVGLETSQVINGLNTEKMKIYALNVKVFF
jgi:hypothetical protein